jgi:3-hydroxyisobutyrate dehydrogenase-like beta-hydroxyacid dehydrogenase
MDLEVIGLLHPGEMGGAIGATLVTAGRTVLWASEGRSPASAERAQEAGLEDAGTVAELAARSDLLLSIIPPHAALTTAGSFGPFRGVYVDANAIAPATTRLVGDVVEAAGGRYVDGSIIGPPPARAGTTRLYLSGPDARAVADVFAGTDVEPRVVDGPIGAASAVKVAYAGWTKGLLALLLGVGAYADAEGVTDTLRAEWATSLPDVPARELHAAAAAVHKGWRWIGEMEEITSAFAANDLPTGFHEAAAEVFRRSGTAAGERADGVEGEALIARVLDAVRTST